MSMFRTAVSQGFTLVEIMVSLVIFLIASMGLLPLLLTNLQVNQDNSLHARARRLADTAMAELQVIDYASRHWFPWPPISSKILILIDRSNGICRNLTRAASR
jgi:prepilin-type N-terminal cleavage/methylation domain-containing protein